METQVQHKHAVEDKNFWENLYLAGTTPWDLGTFTPPLKTFLDSPYAVSPGKIAVVGCGRGYDAMLLADRGFEVTGIDFSPAAIKSTHQKFLQAGISGTRGFLLERNIFDIHEYDRYFDYVFEHTCFCAIPVASRRTYAYTVRDLLKKGGKLIALWWLLDSMNGPPFGVSKSEIFDLFGDYFTFDVVFEPTDSVKDRQGKELFTVMTVK